MDFYDKLDQVKDSQISIAEVINQILNETQSEPYRIKMYIHEIDLYLDYEKNELEYDTNEYLKKVFEEKLTIINSENNNLTQFQKNILKICDQYGYKSIFDLPQISGFPTGDIIMPDYERIFFPTKFYNIYELKYSLENIIVQKLNLLTTNIKMNYLEIVLHGYFNQNDRNHLEKYFQSKFKEAEKEKFIDSEVFFSGCLKVIEEFKNDIQKQISKKKLQLNQYSSQDGEINNDFVKRLKEQIEYQEINGITNIRLGNGTILHLKINEINFIETAIKGAYQKCLKPTTTKKTPFKDGKTKELFEYIVENWNNKDATKWGYIWEYLYTKEHGRLTNKTEFEAYIRENYDFTKGKPNYESCNSKKRYIELDELKEQFEKI
jgi:hypothetical protein